MSKEEAIEILSEMRSEYNLFGDEEEATRYHVLSWAIKQMKVEPVRHGRWTYLYDGNYKCSECGSWWTCEETPIESGMLYCPNCGAKMDEVEDE